MHGDARRTKARRAHGDLGGARLDEGRSAVARRSAEFDSREMTELPRPAERCAIVGVLNVTPDSFSDGGRYTDLDDAVAHALQMRDEGADLIDVGGESTRPGARRVPADEEIRRVRPVVERLAAAGVAVSVDTYRARVASAALDAGAVVVNDVS